MGSRRRGEPVCSVVLGLLAALAGPWPVPAEATDPQTLAAGKGSRTLVIAFDAIPYQVAAQLTSPGEEDVEPLFGTFRGPVPLISTFPSTTTLAFSGLFEPLGMDKPPGYEARFFDWKKGRVRGGGPRSYYKIRFSWREFFDWKTGGTLRKALGFVRPVRFGTHEVEEAVAAFLASERQVFFAYITATDGVGHLKGPEAQGKVLRRLDRVLRRAAKSAPDPGFRTVVFSDHGIDGGEPLKNVRKQVRRAVRQAGFRISDRLRSERDLVFVPYGLVSSFVVFTVEGQGVVAAETLSAVPGVALCASPENGGWRIEAGERGRALVRRRAGRVEEWSYQPLEGDPLDYDPIVQALSRRAGGQREEWFPDDWWLEATRAASYPDALYRIARAFDLVQNPAAAVCSVAPGHMFGPFFTDFASLFTGGRLRWTHGALDRASTLGFIMSDHPEWEPAPAMRFDRALDALSPLMDGSRSFLKTGATELVE